MVLLNLQAVGATLAWDIESGVNLPWRLGFGEHVDLATEEEHLDFSHGQVFFLKVARSIDRIDKIG